MKWVSKPIGAFCQTGSGGTPSRQEESRFYGGRIPWVKSGELKEAIIFGTEETITEAALTESSAKLIPSGALLVAMYGATVGRIAILGIEAASNQAVCHIVPDESVADQRYLFYALRKQVPRWLEQRVGGAQPNINQQIIRDTQIPLPSIEEQRRIAEILDRADAIRRKRQEAIRLTEELLRSAFLEMFGDPVTNPKGWSVVKLEAVCRRITDGTHQPPEWASEGVPFLFVSNIVNGEINFNVSKYITEATWSSLSARCPIELNDILYTTVGSYGNAALVRTEKQFSFQRHIAHIKPDSKKIHPEFLLSLMQSQGIKQQADRQARGVAQKTLNLRELKEFKILVPPRRQQEQYVTFRRTVEHCLQSQSHSFKTQDEFFNSLLQRAFRGEL